MTKKKSATSLISDLKRKTRKSYNFEEKIRIIIDGMRGENSIAELCRKEVVSHASLRITNLKDRSLKLVQRPIANPYSPKLSFCIS